jgi:predicted permease
MMDRLRGWLKPVRALFGQAGFERDLDEEIGFHLDMETRRLVREEGLSESAARRRAERLFGRVERSREGARDVRWTRPLEELAGDARVGVRRLGQDPGFAVVAVVTLALGIGGTAAVFSVVDRVLLAPLPYDEADRIVTLWERLDDGGPNAVSEPNFEDWRVRNGSFEVMALHGNPAFGGPATVLGAETAVRARPTAVFGGFLEVLRVAPVLGRAFTEEDRVEGAPGVVLVSHSFWRSHLASDPAVLGRPLRFWGDTYEVAGVMPEGFHYPGDTDLWLPAERFNRGTGALNRMAHNWAAVGRLRESVTVGEANAELQRIGATLRAEHGEGSGARGAVATRLQEALVGDLRTPLLVLLAASALVLLIACSNLAGTLLGRGMARGRELAVRTALGATRPRLVRQLITENLVLSLLGAAAGLGLALVLGRLLLTFAPPSMEAVSVALDVRVLGFALGLTLLTTLMVGLVPALRASNAEPGEALRAAARGTTGGRSRLWSTLVGGEVALAIVLLAGSGLLVKSFAELLSVHPGFDPGRVLTVDVALPGSKYDTDARKAGYYAALLDDLATVPGVETAGVIQHVPFGGVDWTGSFEIESRGMSDDFDLYGHYRVASAGYVEAMGIPVLRGRSFTRADGAGTTAVAMVNQALADRAWPGEDPIGKRIRDLANEPMAYREGWITVVGVVGNVRHGGLMTDPPPEIYVNVLQRPDRASTAVITLRTSVPPPSLVSPVRARVRALDPDVPVELAPMSARVMDSLASRRFAVLVLGVFAAIALILATVGIYGVVGHTVARRRREIGIRLALGASPRRVRAMVQQSAMRMVVAGAVVGIMVALLATRLISSLLYGVAPHDPVVYSAVTAVLVAAGWLASYAPARRTTRIDPMLSMRGE